MTVLQPDSTFHKDRQPPAGPECRGTSVAAGNVHWSEDKCRVGRPAVIGASRPIEGHAQSSVADLLVEVTVYHQAVRQPVPRITLLLGLGHCHVRVVFRVRSFSDVLCLTPSDWECRKLVKRRPRVQRNDGGVTVGAFKHVYECLRVEHALLRHDWGYWCYLTTTTHGGRQKLGF